MKLPKLLLTGLLLTAYTFGFSQKKEVQIKVHPVAKNIYMLTGQGGNIAISVGEDGILMIDDQFAKLTPKILKAIRTVSDKKVSYLLNTHWHGDHTGGNENMHKEGAIIVAHENVRERMRVDQFQKGRNRTVKAAPKAALPVITFSDNLTFHYNGEDIKAFHVHNAHTDGDAIIYFTESNVLHMGDTYFQGKYPYIDLDSGGSAEGYIAAIRAALMLVDSDTKIIPGHRNISTKAELQKYVAMLEDLKEKISVAIENGASEEEVTQNTDITKKYDALNFGDWFISGEVLRKTFYKSLKNKSE